VEDDPDTLTGIRHLLMSNGYEVLIARSGEEAKLVMLEAADLDLILLDLGLPAGDGHSILSWKKEIDSIRSVPVIVVSAWSASCHAELAVEAGAVAYIEKPAKVQDLIVEINRAINREHWVPEVIG